MNAAAHSHPFLDTIWARLIAAAIAIGGIVLFLTFNWDLLDSWTQGGLGGESAYEQCIEERMAAVAALEEEAASFTSFERELHRQRAQAFCQERAAQ